MRTRTLKILLTTIAMLLLAGTAAVVASGLGVPVDAPEVQEQRETQHTADVSIPEPQRLPALASLQKLARKDLRQRLFDAPPKPEPVIPPKPPPAIRLLGTIVNASNSQAMIAGAGGQVELKRVGDTVGEAGNTVVIQAIDADHITVEHEGKSLEITIIENPGRSR